MTAPDDGQDSLARIQSGPPTHIADLLASAKRLEDDRAKRSSDASPRVSQDDTSEKPKVQEHGDLSEDDTSSASALAAVQLRLEKMTLRHEKQRLQLRKQVADFAMRAVVVQLLIANVLFAGYLFANLRNTDPGVMIAWISATVVEVIGIVYVITRSLFPNGDKPEGKK